MLLDEDPATLLRQCILNFTSAPDRASLSRITSSLTSLSSTRDTRLSSSRSSLKKLERSLASLSQQHDMSLSSHNPAEHAQSILALDAQKFRLAKEASDAEIEMERVEMELQGVEGVLKDLEGGEGRGLSGEEGRAGERAVLKLKLYRSLGIDIDADAVGKYSKAIVRNTRKGDVHVVDLNVESRTRRPADELWNAL